MGRIFFLKGRPNQEFDLLDDYQALGRVTIGYIPWLRINAGDNDNRIAKLTTLQFDKEGIQDERNREIYEEDGKTKISNNNGDRGRTYRGLKRANEFAKKVNSAQASDGAYIVIPRPRIGKFYVGKIESQFEVFCPPPCILAGKELNKAELMQGWKLQRTGKPGDGDNKYLVELPLYKVPGLLRKIMACRQPAGEVRISDKDYLKRCCGYINALIDDDSDKQNRSEIENMLNTLRFDLTTTTFETLLIDLLNCRDEDLKWIHVGGAGDGGIDGAGFSLKDGRLTAVLQCKYETNCSLDKLILKTKNSIDHANDVKIIIATLWNSHNWTSEASKNIDVLLPKNIAELAETYKKNIPSLSKIEMMQLEK